MIKALKSAFLLAALGSGAVAQYDPNFQQSINLLGSIQNPNAQEAARTADEMLKKNSDKSKVLVDNKNPNARIKDVDGATRRMPPNKWRPGPEVAPESAEITDGNGKKIRKRYADLLAAGVSEADARKACDWIVALILAHEMRHVNQDDRKLPTPKDRERDAYEYEIDIETSAFSAGSPLLGESQAVQAAVFAFATEALELYGTYQ